MTTTSLVATCWTSAGAADPWAADDRSPEDIEERVRAVGRAGFQGMGLRCADLVHVRDSIGWRSLSSLLNDNGVALVEVEFLEDWFEVGKARERSDQARAVLLDAAEALGASHLKVGPRMSGGAPDTEKMVEEFAVLCRQAAERGLRVALEPMPFSNLKTPAAAVEIVRRAGHSAGGICLDSWHVFRGRVPLEQVRDLPSDMLVGVELADASEEVVGTLLEDTLNNRVVPGTGSFDLPAFVAAVRHTGYDRPWGVEVISAEQRRRPMRQLLDEAFENSRRLVDPLAL